MTKYEVIALFRSLADDTKEPYRLLTDKALLYLREAEREGAERSLYLHTDKSHNVRIKAGVTTYDLDSSIIFVDRVSLNSDKSVLLQTTRNKLDDGVLQWETLEGKPRFFIIEDNHLILSPIPVEDDLLVINGSRRPCDDMETPEHLHEALVFWLLYRFYSQSDAEIYKPEEARKNLAEFEAVFGKKRKASFDNAWRSGGKKDGYSSPF